MSDTILCLVTPLENGDLERSSLECLNAAKSLKESSGSDLIVGCWGTKPSVGLSNVGASKYLSIEGDAFSKPRYHSDAAAAEALVKASGSTIVIAPCNSRMQRFLPGLSARLQGSIDTHIANVEFADGKIVASRWYYRQRMEAKVSRNDARPWILTIESGCAVPLESGDAVEFEAVEAPAVGSRTTVKSVVTTSSGDQTIRPDSDLLLVAGAGWTKKQADGGIKADVASNLILDFINKKQASLGSSKSMVDLSSEGQAVLPFLTHLHQIGQTGSTPRHAKGLATCCHGEEPHAVGWRFIQERRAINSDANCGWAHGKADVVYIADAFEVMEKVNALI